VDGDPATDYAQRLGERVEALGAALVAAGVDPGRAASLLGAAAAAALDAVTLDLLLTRPDVDGRPRQPPPAVASERIQLAA
jgi:hypothetical protein